jgi:hypothetical protein
VSTLSWFERNPKKTLGALLILTIILLTFAVEKILAYRNRDSNPGIQRYIRLREYKPYFSQNLIPPEAELAMADNLERKPYRFRIDGNGFIMPSQVHHNPDWSLLFLGGSSTACGYMEEEQRFPFATGRLLESRTGKKLNSYNSGVGGNNSLHSLNILLNKVIPLKPEVVCLCHNINDLTTLLLEKTYWSANPSRSMLVALIPTISSSLKEIRDILIPHLSLEVSQLFRELKIRFRKSKKAGSGEDEFAQVRDKKIHYNELELRQAFRNNLQLFIDLCRLHQIRPVLLTQASRLKNDPDPIIKTSLQDLEKRQGLAYPEYKKLFDAFTDEIRETGRKNNILVIDLAAQIPPEKEYLYDIVHFTALGSQRAAEVIADALIFEMAELFRN